MKNKLIGVVHSFEIARLVLGEKKWENLGENRSHAFQCILCFFLCGTGYLIDESPETVFLEFAKTNEYLKAEYQILKDGYKPTTSLQSLVHIIEEYFEIKLLGKSIFS